MMPRATIRFPEDLHAAISAEAERRGKPWTFSSVLIELAGYGMRAILDIGPTYVETDEHGTTRVRVFRDPCGSSVIDGTCENCDTPTDKPCPA